MYFETVFYAQHPNQGNLIQLEGHSLTREPPESTSSQGTGFGKGARVTPLWEPLVYTVSLQTWLGQIRPPLKTYDRI